MWEPWWQTPPVGSVHFVPTHLFTFFFHTAGSPVPFCNDVANTLNSLDFYCSFTQALWQQYFLGWNVLFSAHLVTHRGSTNCNSTLDTMYPCVNYRGGECYAQLCLQWIPRNPCMRIPVPPISLSVTSGPPRRPILLMSSLKGLNACSLSLRVA